MDHLEALVAAWHNTREPSLAELLAQRDRPMPTPPARRQDQVPDVDCKHPLIAELSAREIEVTTLLAQGNSLDEVGAKLFIAPDTIKSHKARIYKKLDITKSIQLGVIAAKAGLV